MGRELRRVPLDFDWPLKKVWAGFLNDLPDGKITCTQCQGSGESFYYTLLKKRWYGAVYEDSDFRPGMNGSTPIPYTHPVMMAIAERNVLSSPGFYGIDGLEPIRREHNIERFVSMDPALVPDVFKPLIIAATRCEAQRLANHHNDSWSHHLNQDDVDALVEDGRLMELTRGARTQAEADELKAAGKHYFEEVRHHPTAAEVNEWSLGGFGHDSINCWVVIRAKCKRDGFAESCEACSGDGYFIVDEALHEASENWEKTDPPEGPGFQLWETVSEGSPVTPVFGTAEELATWLSTPGNDNSVTRGGTFEAWMRMISGPGWMASMIVSNGVCISGPDMVKGNDDGEEA